MAPKKYVNKFNYEDRRLQDDFYELLPKSREGKEAIDLWKTLTREVHPRVTYRYNEIANTHMPLKGL